jgi:2-octaprenylphenol hydroxylase
LSKFSDKGKTMTTNFDVIVIGAGVVGLTAAIAMQQRGFSVALLDSGDFEIHSNNRVYAINDASTSLFSELGIWSLLEHHRLSPYKNMQVWDALSGASIGFDARLMAASQLGFIIEESHIKHTLMQAISGIHLFPNTRVEKVNSSSSGMQVFSENNSWHSTLLMAADGAQSPTRNSLQIPMTQWSYKQQAIVATVETEKPHNQTAYQVFHPEGPLAFLPLANPYQCSIVWTTTIPQAERLMAISEIDFNYQLTAAFAATLGNIKVLTTRQSFPLSMRHTQQYSGSHWLLLGDAAHTIHPLAGLGLNLGLADITTWLDCFAEHNNNLLSSTALGKYQRQRKYATWQVIALMEALKTVFSTNAAPLVALRSLGLRAFDRFNPLKRMIIAEAMGR